MAMLELEIARAPPTRYIALDREGAAQGTVLDLKSEIFLGNLKIHAGGDDHRNCEFSLPRLI